MSEGRKTGILSICFKGREQEAESHCSTPRSMGKTKWVIEDRDLWEAFYVSQIKCIIKGIKVSIFIKCDYCKCVIISGTLFWHLIFEI